MGSRDRELFDLLEPSVASQGVDLVEVSLAPAKRGSLVRLVIYSRAGVSHGDCTRVTRAVGRVLDEESSISGSYTLEVTSPGMSRVLKEEREFDIFRGRRVHLWMKEGKCELSGVALGTREGGSVVLREESGEESVIPWSDVTKARLLATPFGKRGSGGKGK